MLDRVEHIANLRSTLAFTTAQVLRPHLRAIRIDRDLESYLKSPGFYSMNACKPL